MELLRQVTLAPSYTFRSGLHWLQAADWCGKSGAHLIGEVAFYACRIHAVRRSSRSGLLKPVTNNSCFPYSMTLS